MLCDLRNDADWKLQSTSTLSYLRQHDLCNAYIGGGEFGGMKKPLQLNLKGDAIYLLFFLQCIHLSKANCKLSLTLIK